MAGGSDNADGVMGRRGPMLVYVQKAEELYGHMGYYVDQLSQLNKKGTVKDYLNISAQSLAAAKR